MVKRYQELDVMKGIAVLFMIIFHYFYLKHLVGQTDIALTSSALVMMAIISHTLFIFIFGINMSISYKKYKDKKDFYKKQLKRTIIYSLISIGITLFTKKIFPNKYIRFGIFHFLAASIPLSILFMNSQLELIGTIAISALTPLMNHSTFNSVCNGTPLLCFILGLNTMRFNSIDHFSIIPYFAIVLLGILTGNKYY